MRRKNLLGIKRKIQVYIREKKVGEGLVDESKEDSHYLIYLFITLIDYNSF